MPIILLILTVFSQETCLAQQEYLVFLTSRRGERPDQMLYQYMTKMVYQCLEERKKAIKGLTTVQQVEERGRWARETMIRALGPWPPERTPLNAEITGRFTRPGYRVEKLLFQSWPHFYVTATLYLPPYSLGQGPFPAVLGPCGHNILGKAYGPYQTVYATLASLGFVVLTYDPPGQGERLMYYNQDFGRSYIGGSVMEHTMSGIQCLLTGSNAAAYLIWDGIRGIDYLESRPEVDRSRIAVTGCSGGGTLTAYIAALDDRVKAAAPTCYITSWRAMWDTYGMADAEQNLIPHIAKGFGYSDYIMPFVPKPCLINAGIQDFFSIRGARETFVEMKKIYAVFGAEDKIKLSESDEGHGYTKPYREACYDWFRRHIMGITSPTQETQMQPEPVRYLWSTSTGQVSTSYPDAETISSLNAKYAEKSIYKVDLPGSPEAFKRFKEAIIKKVRTRLNCELKNIPLGVESRGFATPVVGTASIERITFESEPGITLPALLIRPESPGNSLPAILYLPHNDKADDLSSDIAELVKAGHTVLAVDLRGKGETARQDVRSDGFYDWFSVDWDIAMMALQLEKPLVGMRVVDILRAVDVLAGLDDGETHLSGIVAVGKGSSCVPLLHAALLDRRISGVILEGGLFSWKAVVERKLHRRRFDNIVPGALIDYDLPVLAAGLAPCPLALAETEDPMGNPLNPEEVKALYSQALHCYRLMGRPENLLIKERPQDFPIVKAYDTILKLRNQ